ncbi:hypothetical protein N9419_06445 [Candidatus Pelagibacter sp.]|jgi:hypothetical protein|nr:hypothetical protein [Candidatus Pelagibacter sp.]
MKSLIKKLFRSRLSIFFRNLLGIRPSIFLLNLSKEKISTSDAFFWRTDKSYYTVFKFTDILYLFVQDNTAEIEILFYDKNNKLVKEIILSNIEIANELIIDKNFLNGIEDYGVFYIFHKSKNNTNSIIRNSCYTGYSFNNSLPSFVHGNLITSMKSFDGKTQEYGIIGASNFEKRIYKVQNYFKFDSTEIMIINPTKTNLEIKVNSKIFLLKSCCSIIVDIKKDELVEIFSKCLLLRPIIFNYKNNFIDVYHG